MYLGLSVVMSCGLIQINYAESTSICRRVHIMHHFGERSFTAAQCRKTCDICSRPEGANVEEVDVTATAAELVRLVGGLGMPGYSGTYVLEVFRGMMSARNRNQVRG
jgi:superfamily II DNA helicase RecQ